MQERTRIVICFILTLSICLSVIPLYVQSSSNTYEYAEKHIYRCNAVTFVDTTAWTKYPLSGDYPDKITSNDGDSTYISCNNSKGYNAIQFSIDTVSDNATLENETYEVQLWVIAKGQLPGVSRLMLAIRQDSGSFYESSFIVSKKSVTPAYANWTVRTEGCPWTGNNWTLTDINAMQIAIWTNGIGVYKVTEVGLIVYTIVPITPAEIDYNYIWILGIVGCILGALIAIVFVIKRSKE